jgi:hypothetical protein
VVDVTDSQKPWLRAPIAAFKVRNKLSVPGPEEKHRCANVTIMLIFQFARAGNIASDGHPRHVALDSNAKRQADDEKLATA